MHIYLICNTPICIGLDYAYIQYIYAYRFITEPYFQNKFKDERYKKTSYKYNCIAFEGIQLCIVKFITCFFYLSSFNLF